MLSLREIRRKIETIEKAISERERMLNHAEQSEDPDQIVRIPLLRNEVEILQAEKQKLIEQAEVLKKSLKEKLPVLEREYLNAVEKERATIRKLYNTCKILEKQIEELRGIANEVHIKYYIPYRNICDELQITSKSFHLLDIPFITQLSRWLANFTEWVEKTRWAE